MTGQADIAACFQIRQMSYGNGETERKYDWIQKSAAGAVPLKHGNHAIRYLRAT